MSREKKGQRGKAADSTIPAPNKRFDAEECEVTRKLAKPGPIPAFLLAGLCALLWACAAAADRPPAEASAAAPGCRTVGADSAEWQAIGRRYATLARAMRTKDFDAMVSLYAPSFEVHEPGDETGAGTVRTREQSIELQRGRMASVVETKLISNVILKMVACGDRATATVLQQWHRTQMVGDTERLVEGAAVQDEEWERTAEGWKRGNIGNIHHGAFTVDSMRIPSSGRYNKDAPPFEPYPATADPPGPAAAPHTCRPAGEDMPTWQAIGRGYARIADAIRRRDLDALLALYAPEIETRTPEGEVWNREQALAYARAGIEQVRESRLVSNTILALEDCGDRATATVLQQWNRTQMFGGQVRKLETAAVQDEMWVSTTEGWKRAGTSNVRRGAWVVDGKRVEPGKPYDPGAESWEPFPEG